MMIPRDHLTLTPNFETPFVQTSLLLLQVFFLLKIAYNMLLNAPFKMILEAIAFVHIRHHSTRSSIHQINRILADGIPHSCSKTRQKRLTHNKRGQQRARGHDSLGFQFSWKCAYSLRAHNLVRRRLDVMRYNY